MIKNWRIGESFELYLTPGLWQSCLNLEALKQVHGAMEINGFNSSKQALRKFIFVAAIVVPCGGIEYAQKVFGRITEPDLFMWNTIIKGSAMSANPENAIFLYHQMGRRGLNLSFIAHQYVLNACANLFWVRTGLGFHCRVVKLGFFDDLRVRNSLIYFHSHCGDLNAASEIFESLPVRDCAASTCLIKGYARRGLMEAARKVFVEMPYRNVFCLNVMITGYAVNGDMDNARRLFDESPLKGVETWNALIAGYVSRGFNMMALKVFEEMRRADEQPNEVTALSLLSACTKIGYLRTGKWIHSSLMETNSRIFSVPIGNALIQMYTKCGSVESAVQVFRGMKNKDTVTWNSMMRGFIHHGFPEEALHLFSEMLSLKFAPNEITFLEVLVACCHTGKVDEGIGHFNLMRTKFNIKPNEKHYSCLVDIYGRAGLLDEALKLIETMEVEPNEKVWRYLVRACRVHGNFELGKYAREQLSRFRK